MPSPPEQRTPLNTQTETRPAPTSFLGIMKELGPGLIVAGSIVGSGELIATTLTGAEAGFWLMWLIIIGCVIKVFAQLEIGRYTISTGRSALEGLSQLPGFKVGGLHWAVWLWFIMFVAIIGQYGGVAGAIGQSASIGIPITEAGKAFNEAADTNIRQQIAQVTGGQAEAEPVPLPENGHDVYYWTLLIAVITSIILYRGRYGLIEKTVMVMVGSFTLLSIVNIGLLQLNSAWAVNIADLKQGLSFQLPPKQEGLFPIATALATFGIIGMAAGELIYYPYWCLEKGYAKFIGPPEDTSEWEQRAKGWIRVMRWDAWCSMVVYTLSTIVFYLLGATVLNRAGLHPAGSELIRTLSAMYEPVFGEMAVALFLFGAFAVLYSTFFVGIASNTLVLSDAIEIFSKGIKRQWNQLTLRPWLNLGLPLFAFVLFVFFPNPKLLILLAGITNTFMLPVLGFAALYYRYHYTRPALKPNKVWDVFLWLSAIALLAVGLWLASRLMGLL